VSKNYLRRYTDIPALISLLSERKITLLDPASWDDKNDSRFLALYIRNDKGEVEHWQSEVTSPNKLARAGWTKYTLKSGEECEISGRAGKNGAHSVWITKIVKSSGETLEL
jgi:Family of unknown function (DUF6152)